MTNVSAIPPVERLALTIPQFCARYGVGRTKLYGEFAAGRLRKLKLDGKTLISVEDGDRWFAKRTGADQ